jgi:hypothetical protein
MRVRGIGRLEDFSKIRPIIKNQAVNLSIKQLRMRQRLGLFLVVWFLMFNGEIFSQKKIHPIPIDTQSALALGLFSPLPSKSYFKKNLGSCMLEKLKDYSVFRAPQAFQFTGTISSNFYASNLSFICRKELEFEKLTSIPLRFRIGSLSYINYLEQKPNYQLRMQ